MLFICMMLCSERPLFGLPQGWSFKQGFTVAFFLAHSQHCMVPIENQGKIIVIDLEHILHGLLPYAQAIYNLKKINPLVFGHFKHPGNFWAV